MLGTLVGYSGGGKSAPTYRSLGDQTEVVLVAFDPARVSFAELVKTFWRSHDPRSTAPWRQYRNVVFFQDETQRETIARSRKELSLRIEAEVVTDVEPAGPFHPAEEYHQKYSLRRHKELTQELRTRYPDEAGFVASTLAARINGYLGGESSLDKLEAAMVELGLSDEEREEILRLVRRS